jgi:sigma-B regulation protein RsbU (phosphoserine phosphatase)
LLLEKQRRRQLEEQKAGLLDAVGDHLAPHPQPFDRSQLRSSWQVEHAQAVLPGEEPGGSFADVQVFSDTKLGLFIGDATGWNASALVERGLANAFWRARASEHLSPAQTMLDVNHLLVDYIAQGDHVTAFYAQVDLLSGAIGYSSAAHTGAYVLGRRGALTMLITRGMPLGVGRELFTDRLEEGHVRLQEGESLLLMTDGVLKAENANGEPFGVERLEKCLRDRPGCDAEAVVATIRDALHQFVGGEVILDESAIVCLRLVNPLVLYPVRVVEPVGAGEPAEHS